MPMQNDRKNAPSEFGGRRGQPYGAGTSASDAYMAERAAIRDEERRDAEARKRRRQQRRWGCPDSG